MAGFNAGDKVRTKSYCTGCKPGEVCILHYGHRDGSFKDTLVAWGDEGDGCSCESNWELITETAYKPITPKVGEKYRVLKDFLTGRGKGSEKVTIEYYWGDEKKPSFAVEECGDVYDNMYLTTEYLELVEERPSTIKAGSYTIADFNPGSLVYVSGTGGCTIADEPDESLLTKATKYMTNLYRRAKLSAAEKTLYKAGYINDDGSPTNKGLEASTYIAFKANEAELVKMAEADLEEQKD